MALAFVSSVLAAGGALVEEVDGAALQAIVPEGLRLELGLPEAPLLALDGRDGSVACGHGTELFQALVARALRGPPLAVAEAVLAPPRPRDPDAYAGLNVALRPGAATASSAWTLTAHLRVEAVADERRLWRVPCAVSLDDGSQLEPPAWDGVELRELEGHDEAPRDSTLVVAEEALARAAAARALEAVAPFPAHVARRLRRDQQRVEGYFAELDADLAERAGRSRAAEALAAKRAALPAARARRLANLREAAVLKVEVTPAALLLVRHPVLEAPLEVLRRKARRTVTVRYHAALRRWSPLACEGCGAATLAFGACDEAVHLLCAACLEDGGEKHCPRCRRGAVAPAPRRIELTGVDEEVAAGPGALAARPVEPPARASAKTRRSAAAGEPPGPSKPSRSSERPSRSSERRAPGPPSAPLPAPARTEPDPGLEALRRVRAAGGPTDPREILKKVFAAGVHDAERRAERARVRAAAVEKKRAHDAPPSTQPPTSPGRSEPAEPGRPVEAPARTHVDASARAHVDDPRQQRLWSEPPASEPTSSTPTASSTPPAPPTPPAPSARPAASARPAPPAPPPPTKSAGAPAATARPAPAARPPAASGPVAEGLAAVLKALMSTREPLSAAEVVARTGVTGEVVRAALTTLVAHGAVQKTGRTKGTRYAWSGW